MSRKDTTAGRKRVQRGRALKGQNVEKRVGPPRGTEICGGAWHSLPPLQPCDRLASLVSIPRTGGTDTAPWMNALSGLLTSLARPWLFAVVRARFTCRHQIFPLFPPLCRSSSARPWPRQSTWADYEGYLGGSRRLFPPNLEIHLMFPCCCQEKETSPRLCLVGDRLIREGRGAEHE